jgi:cytoskeletal protein CcmA (bactofilin family)
MAQIIKHRRGLIGGVKNLTARNGELIIASGSISDLSGPFVFIGSPNTVDEGVAGAFNSVSKLYTGTAAPTITAATYGSVLDGTPYYASGNKSLYILNNSNVGNTQVDLTGNIEGNTISGVTINKLQSTTVSASFFTGSFVGDGSALYNVPASGVTGLELNQIGQGAVTASITEAGGLRINTNTEVTGTLKITGDATLEQDLYVSGNIYQTGSFYTQGNIVLSGSINIGDNLTGDTINFGGEVNSNILPTTGATYDLGSSGKTWNNIWAETAHITTLNLETIELNSISLPGDLTVSGTTILSGSVYVEDLIQGRVTLAGAGGQLVDNENFTYDLANGFLLNTSGSININTSSSLNVYTHDGDRIYMSSSSDFDIDADNDIDLNAGDDIRITANDVFSLRNVGLTDSITLVTKYSSGDDKTLSFDSDGNLTVPGGFTGSYLDINTQAQLASAAVEDLTDNRIVLAGVSGELEDDANFTFDGTTFNIGQGDFEVDTDGDIRTSGSLTINKIYGNTTSNNSLHLNGGDLGAPNVELESSGQISLFSEGAGSNFAINMTGSVNMSNSLGVTGSLTVGGTTTFNNDLNVTGILTVTGETRLQSNLYVSGNLEVLGSSTNVSIQSQTVDIGDNIIQVNAYSPFDRYAGLAAYDSGSSGTSGSFLWDSTNDYWLIVNSNANSSKIIGTTASTGGTGTEISLTSGTFPIATASNTIGDSLLTYSGTTLAYNTNKFTVDSGNGDTAISGNLTLSYSGGTDGGTKTSRVTFRNSSNVLGYVSTTETTNELDGILGYNHSSGVLEFSTLIDGGTY